MSSGAQQGRHGWPGIAAEIGLASAPGLLRDFRWWIAALAALPVWIALAHGSPHPALPAASALFSVVVWQPLIEELLFRGAIQGWLLGLPWGTWSRLGISGANLAASLAFAGSHLLAHPAGWAAAVVVPSLVFGYFRERHASVLPGALLHGWYNAGYYLLCT